MPRVQRKRLAHLTNIGFRFLKTISGSTAPHGTVWASCSKIIETNFSTKVPNKATKLVEIDMPKGTSFTKHSEPCIPAGTGKTPTAQR